MDGWVFARRQIDYPLLLLHKLENVLSIRSKIAYSIKVCRGDGEYYCVGDLYEALSSLYLALAKGFRTKRIEELWKQITRRYLECIDKIEDMEQKLLWGGHLERKYRGIILYDGEVVELEDRECATQLLVLMDKFIEEYIDALDKNQLLIQRQFLGGGREH